MAAVTRGAGLDPARAIGLAVGLGLGGCLIGENPYWDPNATTGQGSTSTATQGGATASGSSVGTMLTDSSPTTAGTGAATEATTGPDGTMGQPCADAPCDEGQSCCRSLQCLDTCVIFCALDPGVCPAGMVCEHGYCLLRCNDDDADCAAWPGFTCEHEGTACENYEPMESTGGTAGSTTAG